MAVIEVEGEVQLDLIGYARETDWIPKYISDVREILGYIKDDKKEQPLLEYKELVEIKELSTNAYNGLLSAVGRVTMFEKNIEYGDIVSPKKSESKETEPFHTRFVKLQERKKEAGLEYCFVVGDEKTGMFCRASEGNLMIPTPFTDIVMLLIVDLPGIEEGKDRFKKVYQANEAAMIVAMKATPRTEFGDAIAQLKENLTTYYSTFFDVERKLLVSEKKGEYPLLSRIIDYLEKNSPQKAIELMVTLYFQSPMLLEERAEPLLRMYRWVLEERAGKLIYSLGGIDKFIDANNQLHAGILFNFMRMAVADKRPISSVSTSLEDVYSILTGKVPSIIKKIKRENRIDLFEYIQRIDKDTDISIEVIRLFYSKLMHRLIPNSFRQLRDVLQVEVSFRGKRTSNSGSVERELEEIVAKMNSIKREAKTLSKGKYIDKVTNIIIDYINLHAWPDGNGRSAYFLAEYLMIQHPDIKPNGKGVITGDIFELKMSMVFRFRLRAIMRLRSLDKEFDYRESPLKTTMAVIDGVKNVTKRSLSW